MLRRARRGTPADRLVIGLGNPGSEYAGSRHNVGAEVVELLASRHGGRLRAGKEQALVDEINLNGQRIALAFPTTYMNESGRSAQLLVGRYGIEDPGRIIIVHDELDLEPGDLRIKVGGGLAGHNGLRSLRDHLHTTDFCRVRIGVGKPSNPQRGASHVLSRVSKDERELLDVMVARAADAVERIIADGAEATMVDVNRRQ